MLELSAGWGVASRGGGRCNLVHVHQATWVDGGVKDGHGIVCNARAAEGICGTLKGGNGAEDGLRPLLRRGRIEKLGGLRRRTGCGAPFCRARFRAPDRRSINFRLVFDLFPWFENRAYMGVSG